MYHNVPASDNDYAELSPSITSYFVPRDVFARQMQELKELRSTCWQQAELAAFYSGACPAHGGLQETCPVVVTFDDGWRESVDVAGPILAGHGFGALLFVTTDLVGRRHFLTRRHLQGLPRQLFQIGSHARTHRLLSRLPKQAVREELHSSKAYLEDCIGSAVNILSIPGGAYDERVRDLAGESGYDFVFTSRVAVNGRRSPALDVGRVAIKRGTSLADFRRFVRQRLGRERLRQWLLAAPKRVLGQVGYEALRGRLLGATEGQKEMSKL